jgi:hypothetical protein
VLRGEDLADLLDRFVDHAAHVLAPAGRLVWMSPLPQRTAARAKRAGLAVELRRAVDMGGFEAELQRFSRPARALERGPSRRGRDERDDEPGPARGPGERRRVMVSPPPREPAATRPRRRP